MTGPNMDIKENRIAAIGGAVVVLCIALVVMALVRDSQHIAAVRQIEWDAIFSQVGSGAVSGEYAGRAGFGSAVDIYVISYNELPPRAFACVGSGTAIVCQPYEVLP